MSLRFRNLMTDEQIHDYADQHWYREWKGDGDAERCKEYWDDFVSIFVQEHTDEEATEFHVAQYLDQWSPSNYE